MKIKRILSLMLACLLVLGSLSGIPFSAGAVVLDSTAELWQMERIPDELILTYEASVSLPTSHTARGGMIVGNWRKYGESAASFEIYENGNPRLMFQDKNAKDSDDYISLVFEDLDARTSDGSYATVSITLDIEGGKATAYIVKGGETTSQTIESVDFTQYSIDRALCVGTDPRDAASQDFKGTIQSVSLYSDVRTESEIGTAAVATDAALLASYDLTNTNAKGSSDLSAKANDLVFSAGVGIAYDDVWYTDTTMEQNPMTYEAWIYVPTEANAGSRYGVIYGNYVGSTNCISFEVYTNGAPRFYYTATDGKNKSLVFDDVDIRTGGWVHLAITADGTNAICYVNGEAKQTKTMSYPVIDTAASTTKFTMGGDLRSSNAQNAEFTGRIREIALYSDVRTAAEIKADMETISPTAEGLLSYYNMNDAASVGNCVEDQGSAGCDMKTRWIDESGQNSDFAYSLAVVGDTQKMTKYDAANGTEYLSNIYTWLLDNKEEEKIEYVMGLGDIVDTFNSTATASEWAWAKEQITRLDGNIAYSLVRGNHDNSTYFNDTFGGHEPYITSIGGYYDEENKTIENTWRKIKVNGVEYLIFTLDYGAKDPVLAWAGEIIDANPQSHVIITTHAYMFRDGTTLDAGDVYPPSNADAENNNGDDMWNEFVSQHENIFLVLSGHDPEDDVIMRQDAGVHGNTVTQMLIDPQGMDQGYLGTGDDPTGMVCLLHFSGDAKTVDVEYYSTVRGAYYKTSNQFTFETGISAVDPDTCAHTETELVVDTQPTAQTKGSGHTVCVACRTTQVENVSLTLAGKVIATCGAEGYTGDVVRDDTGETVTKGSIVPATNLHTESDIIVDTPATTTQTGLGHTECTVCHKVIKSDIVLDALLVATVGATSYDSLEEALTAAGQGQTVKLCVDATEDYVIIDPGVTLDLNGYTLTTDYVIGFATSALIDSSEENTGKLVADKDSVALDRANGGYLPIYDSEQGAYIFTSVNIRQTFTSATKYLFSPVFETFAHGALAQGRDSSGTKVVVRVLWKDETYGAVQSYVYKDSFVNEVMESYTNSINDYAKAFSAVLIKSDADIKDYIVYAAIVSDTGVEIASIGLPL